MQVRQTMETSTQTSKEGLGGQAVHGGLRIPCRVSQRCKYKAVKLKPKMPGRLQEVECVMRKKRRQPSEPAQQSAWDCTRQAIIER